MTLPRFVAKPVRAALPYLASFAWVFAAFVIAQIAAWVALVWWARGDLQAALSEPFDGAVVTISVLVLNPVQVAILVMSVRLKGADPIAYLALVLPRLRALVVGVVGIVAIIGLTDLALLASGRALVSPFQEVSYTSAAAEGWLPLLWFATVVVAPAGEEITFRGYLFRGFVRSERSAWPAIVIIALLWAAPHLQYDWTGISEIFVAGLFLGWVRWRSGSTLLTFLLHALFNLEGMLETVFQVSHSS
jgi:membrane protease YdiL (CAAX protease family)